MFIRNKVEKDISNNSPACPESFFVVLFTNACLQKDSRRASLAGMTFQVGVLCNHI